MEYEIKNDRQRLSDVVPLVSPYTMYIDPSGICNFKCKFCPCNNSKYNIEKRHQMMEFSLFEKIVEDLELWKRKGADIRVINLFGFGEPLLNPHTCDMIKILKDKNLCREVRMTTNGSLLSPELNKRLIDSKVDIVRISVESLDEKDYKELCNTSFNMDSFNNSIKDLYERSRGTNTKISAKIISTCINSDNDVHRFNSIYGPITDHHWIENQDNIWPGYEVGIKNIEGAVQKAHAEITETKHDICSQALINMMVFSNGEVGACCSDWRMDTVYGDVKTHSLSEIWGGERLYELRRKLLLGERDTLASCRECQVLSPDDISDQAEKILEKLG